MCKTPRHGLSAPSIVAGTLLASSHGVGGLRKVEDGGLGLDQHLQGLLDALAADATVAEALELQTEPARLSAKYCSRQSERTAKLASGIRQGSNTHVHSKNVVMSHGEKAKP